MGKKAPCLDVDDEHVDAAEGDGNASDCGISTLMGGMMERTRSVISLEDAIKFHGEGVVFCRVGKFFGYRILGYKDKRLDD